MKKRISKKGIIVLAAALLIAVITAVSVNVGGSDGPFTNVMNAVTKPFKVGMSHVASAFESIYGYMYEYDRLKEENERLKAENAEFQQQTAEYIEMSEENERLREFMGLPARFSKETASILSWGASNWASTFVISKGSENSEVEVGDGVITSSGALIGQITEVGDATSTCISIIDTSFSAGVTVGAAVGSTVATGDFSLMRLGLLSLSLLDDTTEVVAGDAVVTSGKGGVFPKGLVIGYVEDVSEYDTGIGKYAAVLPSTEFSSVIDVYVIVDFEVSE